jgi:excisionase family DNA binding protein
MRRKNQINHLLTVEEVAEKLRLGPRTVYRLIEAGKLKVIKISRKAYRISEKELIRFLKRHQKL